MEFSTSGPSAVGVNEWNGKQSRASVLHALKQVFCSLALCDEEQNDKPKVPPQEFRRGALMNPDRSMPANAQSTLSMRTVLCVVMMSHGVSLAQDSSGVQFAREVKPILSNHCWTCHGPDETGRQGNLRLDVRDDAIKGGESGFAAIVPGKPADSELLKRINSHDADLQMPPASTKKPLTPSQIDTLTRWIEQGAPFAAHWAFIPPERPTVAVVKNDAWPTNEIDQFILHRLEKEQLPPSDEAKPFEWLRRVSLDLTGLPPSIDELDQFETDLQHKPSLKVYEAVVDRLLSSDRHAERMAMLWLDAARYADTNGYNNDEIRTMWPWRDWVINAFRQDMPYDQFLTEQLAGDLLPNASISQKVATGFCRNHVLTTEGGIIEEEYHVEYVADRVHTASTVFMALSLQCARCHDHKYDPFSQRDYYQLGAFFNNVPDKVVSYNQARMAEPLLKVPTAEQTAELDRIATRMVEIEKLLEARKTSATVDAAAWEGTLTADVMETLGPASLAAHFDLDADGTDVANRVVNASPARIEGSAERVDGKLGKALKFDGSNYVTANNVGDFDRSDRFTTSAWIQLATTDASTVLSKIDEGNNFRGYDVILEGAKVAAHFVDHWPDKAFKVVAESAISLNEWHHIVVVYDGSGQSSGVSIYVDGKVQKLTATTDNKVSGSLKTDKPFHIGRRQNSANFKGLIDDVRVFSTALSADDVVALTEGRSFDHLKSVLQTPQNERSEAQKQTIVDYFLRNIDESSKALRAELAELPKHREAIEKEIPATMVMAEPETPRAAYILKRGQYDQRGDEVTSDFPQVFASVMNTAEESAAGMPASVRTRLDLARWLTNPQHPLTARVAVNRLWETIFGMGLVETSEDFGIQGALPSHPELLDWLATELIRNRWSQRAILKQIVLSSTYRQSSNVSAELLERDPRNRLFARSPRYRLPAETVRDSALFVSGLLKEKIGGPSVKPYQPEGLWEDVSVERRDKYVPDGGDGLYRRSMYTFWKRTCPPPGMSTFDAPDRETCIVRRARTNTPLQALVLLNDPTYVEAARQLATRAILHSPDPGDRLDFAFRAAVSRSATETERAQLMSLIESAEKKFAADETTTREYLSIGKSPIESDLSVSELAAWSTAMSVMLNLDEVISR